MDNTEALGAMTQDDDKALRARNVRTALVLAAIALAVFVSFIVRSWYLGHGG